MNPMGSARSLRVEPELGGAVIAVPGDFQR